MQRPLLGHASLYEFFLSCKGVQNSKAPYFGIYLISNGFEGGQVCNYFFLLASKNKCEIGSS